MIGTIATIGSLLGTAAKAGVGIGQLIKGSRDSKRLWKTMPTLGVTQGEKLNNNLYSQMASATELPGQRQYLEKIDQNNADALYQVQRSANSPYSATQAAMNLAQQKNNAVRDLALNFAQFKQQRMEDLAGWNKERINLDQQRWKTNFYDPWNMKMNEASEMKKAGMSNLFGAVDTGMGMLNDMAGTAQMMEIYKRMFPNTNGIGGTAMKDNRGTLMKGSIPAPFSGLANNIKVNFAPDTSALRAELLKNNGGLI